MNNDDEFEVIDLAALRRNRTWIQQVIGDVSRQSVARQIAIGGGSGWVAGYMSIKVGKIAAVSLGTTIILIQVAQHQGYVQVNWPRVHFHLTRARQRIESETARNYPHIVNHLKRFVQDNVFLAASFAGGFLIGITF